MPSYYNIRLPIEIFSITSILLLTRKLKWRTTMPMEDVSAPYFELPTNGRGTVNLNHLRGRRAVLYFYPKDDTPGCTTEAKDFRDAILQFKELETEIIGISRDTVESHDKFSDKCSLPFLLASDIEGKVCELYGVWKKKQFMGKSSMGIVRSTFLIGKDGIIKKVWRNVSVPGHVDEVLEAIKKLND